MGSNLRENTNGTIMGIIFILILVSLIIALGFLGAFIWAVKSGQYDDDYTPSVRILFDDEKQTQNDKS
jgi:cbb3-type cytochrome oxidase maturation protein